MQVPAGNLHPDIGSTAFLQGDRLDSQLSSSPGTPPAVALLSPTYPWSVYEPCVGTRNDAAIDRRRMCKFLVYLMT